MKRSLTCIFFAMIIVGCSAHKQPHARATKPPPAAAPVPVVREEKQEMAFQQPQSQHPAREGRPPLVYLLESPAKVEVVDTEDGAVIARATLTGRAIISVDATNGVRAAQEQLARGPLPSQHTYQIFIITGTENSYRTEVIKPGDEK